ncbi:MIP/aquaporin family protein [Sulfobacillus thermosulfidooxidans]|uniref:MIP/aquaporin family protein n=1 Tax=Sulfobacillus thermosulfidooxidans TaxID=28034 RepID=UPI000312518A|nr:MIP/aquaporin family protein [Sulfobacillus thermosulfidooxidans]
MKVLFLGFSEFVGTFLLIAVGCSFVVVDFAASSPVVHWIPDAGLRRALTGFLFGSTGGLIALSWVGKWSGAHINPVVTVAFWWRKKIAWPTALTYIVAQCAGAIGGAWTLRIWGAWAKMTQDAITVPGRLGPFIAVLGEMGATFCLIVGLFVFLGHKPLRRFTPGLFPALYAFLVYIEAPLSGTSTNPARTLGPEIIAHDFSGWWVYWIGPVLGCVVGLFVLDRLLPYLNQEILTAKVFYVHHDPHRMLSGN